ncbi:MAG: RDD family protein [bacterium]|nr:RDD family protein [bacterium]
MHCPHCSKVNSEDASYCAHCGRELPRIAPQADPATHSLNVAPVQYAGFWRRVLASLIDGLLLSLVTGSFTWTVDFDDFKISFVLAVVVQWLYFALLEISNLQATLCKMAIGIVVTDEQYRRLNFPRATARFFGKFLSGIILGIGFIMAGFTQKKQALHDILADTLVLQK